MKKLYFKQANKRVMNINFGETQVLKGLDVVAKVGPNAAYDEYIEFQLNNGEVFVNGKKCSQAFKNGKLVVVFEKTDKDLPKIEGLLLVEGTLQDTDYATQESMRQEWMTRIEEEKRLHDEERKRKMEVKRKLMQDLGNEAMEVSNFTFY